MATILRYVDPDAAGAGNGTSWTDAYTKLATWESSEQTNLVTAGDFHNVYCRASAGTIDTNTVDVVIAGWTTDSSHYISVISADVGQVTWDTSKYRIGFTAGTGYGLDISQDYTIVYGLCIQSTYRRGCRVTGAGVFFDRCMIRVGTTYASSYGIGFVGSGTTCWMRNTLIFGYGSEGTGCQDLVLVDNGTLYANNCTAVTALDDGWTVSTDGTLIIKNSIAKDCAGTDYVNGNTLTASYCGYEGSDPGSNGIDLSGQSLTDMFTDPGNYYYTVKGTGSLLYNAGTNLSGDTLAVNYDRIGVSRPQSTSYDLGCYEYVVAAGSTSYSMSISDVFKGSESISLLLGLSNSLSDGIELGESITENITITRTLTDGIKNSDSSTINLLLLQVLSDISSLSDTNLNNLSINFAISDIINNGDSISLGLSYTMSVTDGVTKTDVSSNLYTFNFNLSDSVVLSDLSNALYSLLYNFSENVNLSDTNTSLIQMLLSLTDEINLSDLTILDIVTIDYGFYNIYIDLAGKKACLNLGGKKATLSLNGKTFDINIEGV